MGRLLALDYGERRIGVAISDELKIIATVPEPPLPNGGDLLDKIAGLKEKYAIEKIVLGLPKGIAGGAGTREAEVKKFGQTVSARTGLPCEYFDERFSTERAKNLLSAQAVKPRKRKKYIDNLSALVILEGYLDSTGK